MLTGEVKSHPAWVCGLKQSVLMRFPVGLVTPCVGVWIETLYDAFIAGEAVSHPAWVCGLKLNIRYSGSQRTQSHPAWVCGLKP